jgi:CDP-diacylglycerol--glycerol-3-phosphate 3-phosphatidyltransferase
MSQSRDERREATAPPAERPDPTASPADRPDPTNPTDRTASPGGRSPSRPESSPVAAAPSSAIVTAPNAISLARLLLMPVCAWLLATQHYASGLVLTTVVGASDWVDGWLARRIRQVSRVGQLLDPFADRTLIASVAVALLVRGVLPWPAVALLVGRDLVLLAGWPLLKRRGVEPPEVVWIGKAATFDLLIALPLLVMGETTWVVATVAHALGLALLWLGVVLYYVAGVVYVRMALDGLARRARAGT